MIATRHLKKAQQVGQANDEQLSRVSLDLIDPHPDNPRQAWPEEGLQSLAASMRSHGVIQPIVVRPSAVPGRYQLIAGERRFRAASLAGLEDLPATIREVSDAEALALILAENLEREDLNPIEMAMLLQKICSPIEDGGGGKTHDQAAAAFGRQGPWASGMIRMLRLPEYWQELIRSGELSLGCGEVLTSYCDQADVLKEAEEDKLANPWAWRTKADVKRNIELIAEGQASAATKAASRSARSSPAKLAIASPVTARGQAAAREDDADDSNRCPDCGWSPLKGHRCGVPVLQEAIGLDLTPTERKLVRWLAQTDRETIEGFAGLFRRIGAVNREAMRLAK